MMLPILIDFETQSNLDVREVGGRKYCKHSSTKILCLCLYADGRYFAWVPDNVCSPTPRFTADGVEIRRGAELPADIIALIHANPRVAAHNASSFDRYLWERFIGIPVTWVDTIHQARAAGLPASLDDIGTWYTGKGKHEGKAVLSRIHHLEWVDNQWSNRFCLPGAVETVVRYCLRDVEMLKVLVEDLQDFPFTESPALDYTINQRGVAFDEEMAGKLASISTRIITDSVAEIHRIAPELRDVSLRSIPAMQRWLKSRGVNLNNLRRETVEQFINDPEEYLSHVDGLDEYLQDYISVNADTLRVMKLRNASLRITGAKLQKASEIAEGGRLYDMFVYWAAHTGRFSSRIFQVHNLPRGNGAVNVRGLCENLSNLTYESVTAEAERCGISPDDVLSTLIRPCLHAKPGHVLVPVDFNAIETRVVYWLAGHEDGLEGFRQGLDPYKVMAAKLFNVEYSAVTKVQRQMAKAPVLGGVYGLGPKRLGVYAKALGIDFDASGLDPVEIINAFRDSCPKIAGEYAGEHNGFKYRSGGLWKDYEAAFRNCVLYDTPSYAGRCYFRKYRNNNVLIRLPSGRHLCYRKVRVEDRVPAWGGEPRPTILYTGGRGERILHGGVITENCLTADTRVLTYNGVKPIIDVQCGDRVWDGLNWVTTTGCVAKGERKVGRWLGVGITGDHLIHDGWKWGCVGLTDENTSARSLNSAVDSIKRLLLEQSTVGVGVKSISHVIAEFDTQRPFVDLCGTTVFDALSAGISVGRRGIRTSSQTQCCGVSGPTDTPVLSPDVTISGVKHTQITGDGVSSYMASGSCPSSLSYATPLPSPDGMTLLSTLIESTTTEITNQGTLGVLVESTTHGIDVVPYSSPTNGNDTTTVLFERSSYPNGRTTPPLTIFQEAELHDGLWRDTGRQEEVFDLLNCGELHRFTILTDCGPVVVHNCTQAVARDLLYEKSMKIDETYPVVLHVHDEIVPEVDEKLGEKCLADVILEMKTPPSWGLDLPLGAEGHIAPRYTKEKW